MMNASLDVCVFGFDTECKRQASPFKEREEPSEVPSSLSSGVLHVYLLDCLRG
jgi:hypothetical protein